MKLSLMLKNCNDRVLKCVFSGLQRVQTAPLVGRGALRRTSPAFGFVLVPVGLLRPETWKHAHS